MLKLATTQLPYELWPCVFSDVDDTIIRGKSLAGFLVELASHSSSDEARRLRDVTLHIETLLQADAPRAELNALYYQHVLVGRTVAEVERCARAWFARSLKSQHFLESAVVEFLRDCMLRGSRLVLVTGSFSALLQPLLALLGGGDILGAPLEVTSGVYTGRLLGPPVIGAGKVTALQHYAREHGVSLERCVGVGDDLSDLPFLQMLGTRFVPRNAHSSLLERVGSQGWHVLETSVGRYVP
ncbi:MAG: hypothetical protein RL701_1246 [Pseudomonadota bacterium]